MEHIHSGCASHDSASLLLALYLYIYVHVVGLRLDFLSFSIGVHVMSAYNYSPSVFYPLLIFKYTEETQHDRAERQSIVF